jgi:germination protein M
MSRLENDTAGRRSPVRMVLWGLAALILAGGAGLLFWPRAIEPPEVPPTVAGAPGAATTASIMLFFGDRDARGLATEQRLLPSQGPLETRIVAVVAALIDGPEGQDLVRCLPPDTHVRRVFHDDESATLFLDFDPALVTHHPGGSAAEWATLASLVRTIGSNFPEIARVQVLVDGDPVDTLAGHFDTSHPLEVAAWQ